MLLCKRTIQAVCNRCFHVVSCMMSQRLATATKSQSLPRCSAATSVEPVLSSSTVSASVRYVRVPFGETFSQVGFVDVGAKGGPIVVALHGAPGSLLDFAELYRPLTDAGIRVIVPEFPGYGHTTVEAVAAFDESTEARATLVQNLLQTIGVNRVTAVAGHSMGVVTAFHLAANSDLFSSVIYLNGVGFQPHRSVRPFWLTYLFARLLQNSWTEPIVKNLLSFAYSWKGYNSSSIGNGNQMKTGIVSVLGLGFDRFQANVTRARDKGTLPMFFSFTKNDRLIQWQLPMEVVKHCGIADSDISWVDANEQITKGPSIDCDSAAYRRAIVFDRGGHFVQRSHQQMISQALVSFIHQVQSHRLSRNSSEKVVN